MEIQYRRNEATGGLSGHGCQCVSLGDGLWSLRRKANWDKVSLGKESKYGYGPSKANLAIRRCRQPPRFATSGPSDGLSYEQDHHNHTVWSNGSRSSNMMPPNLFERENAVRSTIVWESVWLPNFRCNGYTLKVITGDGGGSCLSRAACQSNRDKQFMSTRRTDQTG